MVNYTKGKWRVQDLKELICHEEDYNQKYYVTQDGYAFTDPMTAAEVVSKFGPIRELEANGFRVVKV